MSSDHLYFYPNGAKLDNTIEGAKEIGLRFFPTSGVISIEESDCSLPPDGLFEKEHDILEDCIPVIDKILRSGSGLNDPCGDRALLTFLSQP